MLEAIKQPQQAQPEPQLEQETQSLPESQPVTQLELLPENYGDPNEGEADAGDANVDDADDELSDDELANTSINIPPSMRHKCKYNKSYSCVFCEKSYTVKISRHLATVHKNQKKEKQHGVV